MTTRRWRVFGRLRGPTKVGLDKWWLLPFGVLAASALLALGIFVLAPSYVAADCAGASASDFACYQQRYQGLCAIQGSKPPLMSSRTNTGRTGS
jgi:hypothetical protein